MLLTLPIPPHSILPTGTHKKSGNHNMHGINKSNTIPDAVALICLLFSMLPIPSRLTLRTPPLELWHLVGEMLAALLIATEMVFVVIIGFPHHPLSDFCFVAGPGEM